VDRSPSWCPGCVDKDPGPAFKARTKHRQTWNRKQLEQAGDESVKDLVRSGVMRANWKMSFRDVTADEIYLLTSSRSGGIQSTGAAGKRWIVSKVVEINRGIRERRNCQDEKASISGSGLFLVLPYLSTLAASRKWFMFFGGDPSLRSG
jgi:hypothetical protein